MSNPVSLSSYWHEESFLTPSPDCSPPSPCKPFLQVTSTSGFCQNRMGSKGFCLGSYPDLLWVFCLEKIKSGKKQQFKQVCPKMSKSFQAWCNFHTMSVQWKKPTGSFCIQITAVKMSAVLPHHRVFSGTQKSAWRRRIAEIWKCLKCPEKKHFSQQD